MKGGEYGLSAIAWWRSVEREGKNVQTIRAAGLHTVRTLEQLCWAAGIVLLLVHLTAPLWARYAQESAQTAFHESRGRDLRYGIPDQSLWAPSRIRQYDALRASLLPPAEAIIRIRSLPLEVPVFPGATEINMTRGAGRLPGSPGFGEPGNVAVSSHRDGFFRKLKDIRIGDDIVVETRTATYRYIVEEIRITDPWDTTVLWPGSLPELTLVTCYPFYHYGRAPQRFIVRAELRQE
jgi:sortase A